MLDGFATSLGLMQYAPGLDVLWGMYRWLDRAPKGRNETGAWWRRHDEYDKRWIAPRVSLTMAKKRKP
jgi:predicted dithiol-disulfide oxidoreductase (DUF899 family)